MKLLLLPLAVLFILSILSLTGLGYGALPTEGELYIDGKPYTGEYYADSTGRPVCYSNFTVIASEEGLVIWGAGDGGWYVERWSWKNATGTYHLTYSDVKQGIGGGFDIGSSLGLIGIVIGIMALAAFAGIKILGSGVSDVSVSTILVSSAFLALWAIFSVLSMSLIISIPLFGVILYFALTGMYTVGIINRVGGGGGGDY